jgi:transcriptional regulator with XRE-family HTH domain
MCTSSAGSWRAQNVTELGRALARARASRGLSQQALAAKLQMERAYLSRMEGGLATEQMKRTFAVLRELGMELVIQERNAG